MALKDHPVSIATFFCLMLGGYQIFMTTSVFILQDLGTSVEVLTPKKAFGKFMNILYCAADWMDPASFQESNLTFDHMWYLAYWLEILSGEHGRLGGLRAETYNALSDNSQLDIAFEPLDVSLKRSLSYLESISFLSEAAHNTALNWKVYLESINGITIRTSAAWDYAKPKGLNTTHRDTFLALHEDLTSTFGSMTPANVYKMFEKLARNPLDDGIERKLEFRYGLVCHRVPIQTDASMSAVLRRPLIKRAEALPDQSKRSAPPTMEVLERYATFPAGVHVSTYIGGMFPVWGGDDDNQYRANSLVPCNSGGYLIREKPPSYVPEPMVKHCHNPILEESEHCSNVISKIRTEKLYCENRCVDSGIEVEVMVARIKADVYKKCGCLKCDGDNFTLTRSDVFVRDNICSNDMAKECAYNLVAPILKAEDDMLSLIGASTLCPPSKLRSSSFEDPTGLCKDPERDDLSHNKKLQFGKRMLISVYTLRTVTSHRLSTRKSPCTQPVNEDDMLPVYQLKNRCEAICQDKQIHRNTSVGSSEACTVSGLIFPDQLTDDLPACDVLQFWENVDSVNKSIQLAIDGCVVECEKVPSCRTFQGTLERGDQLYVKDHSEEPYNFHEIRISPISVEMTTEFFVMPWDSYIANCGGLFGFFIGLSLLQLLMLPVTAWQSRKKQTNNVDDDSDKPK